jgi:hypothetical protein
MGSRGKLVVVAVGERKGERFWGSRRLRRGDIILGDIWLAEAEGSLAHCRTEVHNDCASTMANWRAAHN